MNIAYFRKTDKSIEEAVASLTKELEKKGITVDKETKLPSGSVLVRFLDIPRFEKIVGADRMVIELMPMVAMIEKKDGAVSIGVGNPQLLLGSPHLADLQDEIETMNKDLREIVNAAAGVGEPKVEKVKLFSTATCPYCKMEKDYLDKNKVQFDLVMVDADKEAAQEMVRKTGQMGVPATEIVFDDGDSEIIVGFDKGRLNELLKIGA